VTLKTGSAATSVSDGTDVTSRFVLDNGQRDTFYDLANLNKVTGFNVGATDYLLVNLDYFVPNYSAAGSFFTIDSYPINDGNTTSSQIRTEDIPVYISSASVFKI
jgi:hypothetical protein